MAVLLRRSHGSATIAARAPSRRPASAPTAAALRRLVAEVRTATAGLHDPRELDVLGEREELLGGVAARVAPRRGADSAAFTVRFEFAETRSFSPSERPASANASRCCPVRRGDPGLDVAELILVVCDLLLEQEHLLRDVGHDRLRDRVRERVRAFSALTLVGPRTSISTSGVKFRAT